MNIEASPVLLSAASGKTICSAQVVHELQDVHGVLLIFTDGTELSIDFYPRRVKTRVRHYRFDETGEAATVKPE